MSSTFDADLARANLMRVRAEFRKAEQICIEILKGFPKSAATHSLMGDIYADQGQLDQAAHWYELSLDLDPSSMADRQKLNDVREQIEERDHISSAAQLGLPDQKTVRSVWMAGVSVCVFVVAIGLGFAVKYGNLSPSHDQPVVKTPINAVADNIPPHLEGSYASMPVPKPTLLPSGAPTTVDNSSSPAPTSSTIDDQALEAAIIEQSPYGTQLVSLVQDPRTKVALMTYLAGPKDDARVIGANLAKTLFDLTGDPEYVTIRAMRFEKLLYMADVPRSKYDETQTDEWKAEHTSPEAWIPYIMTNEWPSKDGANKSTPPESLAADAPDPRPSANSPFSAGSTSGGDGAEPAKTPVGGGKVGG